MRQAALTKTDDDIPEALDWEGNQFSCEACPHRALLAQRLCRRQQACVYDRYARRIDRFFEWNPRLSDDYLHHPYFEVRAIAAKYADETLLPWVLRDSDETVRWSAAQRLPKRYLMRLIDDPHREVRIRVAHRIDDTDLFVMMKDDDYYVRQIVARRIAPKLLQLMVHDPDPEVRCIVARRIGTAWLTPLANDQDGDVRLEAARRLAPELLKTMQHDPDWRVRYEVAGRIESARLAGMADDPDPLVQERARERLHGNATEFALLEANEPEASNKENAE